MIAYYRLIGDTYEGSSKRGETHLVTTSDLVISHEGRLVKDRQGYVGKAIDDALQTQTKQTTRFDPEIGTKWVRIRDEDGLPVASPMWIYVGHQTYYKVGAAGGVIYDDLAGNSNYAEVK